MGRLSSDLRINWAADDTRPARPGVSTAEIGVLSTDRMGP